MDNQQGLGLKIKEWVLLLIIIGAIASVGNFIGFQVGIIESMPGMLVLIIISLVGLILNHIIPWKIPTVIYISIIGLLVALPVSPISDFVIESTQSINLLALATPILGYSGVVVGRDWKDFTKVGWRGLLVSLLVVIGTFVASSGVAEILFRYVFN